MTLLVSLYLLLREEKVDSLRCSNKLLHKIDMYLFQVRHAKREEFVETGHQLYLCA